VALALYKPDLAIKALSEAAELSVRKWPLQPFGEAVIHIRLAQAYIDGRRADLALPILEAMVKEPPQYEQYRWSMTWELARAYKNLEQTPRAQKLFMQLVKEIRASKEMTEEQRQGWEYKFLILPQEIRMLVIGEGHVKTQ
jgi:predicted Zn-dependent protease